MVLTRITVEECMELIRREFLEMPGLRLTLAQACRLWDVCPGDCQAALDRLIAQGFLRHTSDGQYARADVRWAPSWVA